MDTRWLQVFVDLEALGTLRAVADANGYSTSAVSQHLARLQEELGAQLVEPVGRRLHLTPAGLAFLPHARVMLRELEAGRGQLAEGAAIHGVVRIAGYTTILAGHVAPVAIRLQEEHPGLEIRIEEREPDEVRMLLAEDRIDVGIVYDHILVPDPALREPYAEAPMLLVVPRDERRTARQIIGDPSTLWIGNSRAEDDDAIIRHITAAMGVQARIPHHIDSTHLLSRFIARGYGAGLVSSDTARDPDVRYIDVGELAGSRRSYTITRPGRESWPINELLIRAIHREAARPGRGISG